MTVRRRLTVSSSELSHVRTCRQKWWFRYHEKLDPIATRRAFAEGTLVHLGLQALYESVQRAQWDTEPSRLDHAAVASAAIEAAEQAVRGGGEQLALSSDDSDDRDAATVDLAVSVLRRYARSFLQSDLARYRVMAVEPRFEVPLVNGVGQHTGPRYMGYLDLLVYDVQAQQPVLHEHKTTSGDASEFAGRLDLDPQVAGYLYALHHMAPMEVPWLGPVQTATRTVAYNVLRKNGPREPNVNRDGRVSAAAVDTVREVYQRALDTQPGGPPSQAQLDRLAQLPDAPDRFIKRHWMVLPERDIERWRADAYEDVREIRQLQAGRRHVTRNPHSCAPPWGQWCPYRPVCIEDDPALRAALYRPKTNR